MRRSVVFVVDARAFVPISALGSAQDDDLFVVVAAEVLKRNLVFLDQRNELRTRVSPWFAWTARDDLSIPPRSLQRTQGYPKPATSAGMSVGNENGS